MDAIFFLSLFFTPRHDNVAGKRKRLFRLAGRLRWKFSDNPPSVGTNLQSVIFPKALPVRLEKDFDLHPYNDTVWR